MLYNLKDTLSYFNSFLFFYLGRYWSEIKDLTDNAINNAKKLEKIHASEIDFSKKIPCTMVHKLVISLIEKSK